MWARARGTAASLVALAAVLVGLVVLVGGIAPAQAPDPDSEAAPPPGSLLLALRSLGQVNAVLPTGGTLVLARNLAQPVAVAVLSDSSVLVAENGANRVSGFGGRFGATPVRVADVTAPTGLVVGAGDAVFVTAGDQVGRIDFATGQVQTLARGFVAPIGPAIDGNRLYVPDLGAGRVATIDATTGADLGALATGLAGPGGAATAPGLPVFVTETQGEHVVRVEPGGAPTVFANVPGALQVALDPATPDPGSDWKLVVTTQDGYVHVTSKGQVEGVRAAVPGVAGAVVMPDASAAAGGATTGTGSSTVLKDEPASSSSPLAVIVVLVALLVIVVIGATVWFARRAARREREDDAFMPPSPDAAGLPPVLGSCTDEEVEVDRLQERLRHVRVQLDESQTRLRRAAELASDARDRAMRALEVRTSLRAARLEAEPLPQSEKLTWAQLSFSTNEGRETFDSFRRREIDAAELKSRLAALGETTAIAQISEEGRRQIRGDRTIPWPEERAAVRDAIAAREELRAHVRDAEEARAEADQLAAHQKDLSDELDAARRRLDDCRRTGADAATAGNA